MKYIINDYASGRVMMTEVKNTAELVCKIVTEICKDNDFDFADELINRMSEFDLDIIPIDNVEVI